MAWWLINQRNNFTLPHLERNREGSRNVECVPKDTRP